MLADYLFSDRSMAQRQYQPQSIPIVITQKDILIAVQYRLFLVFVARLENNMSIIHRIVHLYQNLPIAVFGGRRYNFSQALTSIQIVGQQLGQTFLFTKKFTSMRSTRLITTNYTELTIEVGQYLLPALNACKTLIDIITEMSQDASNPNLRGPYRDTIWTHVNHIASLSHDINHMGDALDKVFQMVDDGILYYPTPAQEVNINGKVGEITPITYIGRSAMTHYLKPIVLARVSKIIGGGDSNNKQ